MDACRGRVGYSLSLQSIEICFVIVEKFEVFDTFAAAENVIGEVENVVGFMVRQMELKQMKIFIQCFYETCLAGQLVHYADASADNTASSVSDLVVDITC